MKNKILSIVVGLLTTVCLAVLGRVYLSKYKNQQNAEASNAFWQILETMDHRFNDIKFKLMSKKHTQAPVVLVAVDEESLREIGRWPWGRDVAADLIEKLISYGVKTVGMDVIQSEPDLRYPEHDQKMASVVEKYRDKIVLGTYSEDRLLIEPYKDYCVTEAFVLNGGEHIVKINTTFVVDDMSDNFEDLPWGNFFEGIFKLVQKKSESDYLSQLGKKSVEELSQFQTNYLKAKKVRDVFQYCQTWLTAEDWVYNQNMDYLREQYREIFKNKKGFKGLPVDDQLRRFKNSSIDYPTPQYGQWQDNIGPIQEASLYTGSFVAQLDIDGYVRRYPLFYRSGNKIGTSFVPSLALQTYLAAEAYRADVKVEVINGKKVISSFQIINPKTEPETLVRNLPVDSLGRLIVGYYGPSFTLPYVSAKDLFSDDPKIAVMTHESNYGDAQVMFKAEKVDKKQFFKDKVAVLGATAIGIYDLRNTPVAANYPGPEIHLTMIANLFDGKFYKNWNKEDVMLPATILVAGVWLSLILSMTGALGTLVSLSLSLGAQLFLENLVFENYQILFSGFFITLLVVCVHFNMFLYKYFSEERKRNALKKTFSKYVSPAVVDELLKNEDNLKLGGKKQELSVFFSDVRGFTEFSEKMDPEELSQFLNEYLTPMTEMVFNNKGTLDKYMGDGLMAFFGAPVPFEDHAYCACKCALESLRELKILQDEFAKRGWPHVDIGIGINTGMMSVGNMGSKIVQSYTVIGDAVNLGSRLEGTTKEYGAKILVSETTYEKVKNQFVFREVDRVRVKGKKEPVRAYELLAEKAESETVIWLDRYREAYQVYHNKNFSKAFEMFDKLEDMYPNDKLIRVYKERCEFFLKTPPDPSWDGVYERRTK